MPMMPPIDIGTVDYQLTHDALLLRPLCITEQENVSVFNFYNYLRTHPLLLRQKLANQADSKGMKAAAVLSGFSHAASESNKVAYSANILISEFVTLRTFYKVY